MDSNDVSKHKFQWCFPRPVQYGVDTKTFLLQVFDLDVTCVVVQVHHGGSYNYSYKTFAYELAWADCETKPILYKCDVTLRDNGSVSWSDKKPAHDGSHVSSSDVFPKGSKMLDASDKATLEFNFEFRKAQQASNANVKKHSFQWTVQNLSTGQPETKVFSMRVSDLDIMCFASFSKFYNSSTGFYQQAFAYKLAWVDWESKPLFYSSLVQARNNNNVLEYDKKETPEGRQVHSSKVFPEGSFMLNASTGSVIVDFMFEFEDVAKESFASVADLAAAVTEAELKVLKVRLAAAEQALEHYAQQDSAEDRDEDVERRLDLQLVVPPALLQQQTAHAAENSKAGEEEAPSPDEPVPVEEDLLGYYTLSFSNRSKNLTERRVRTDFGRVGSVVARVQGLGGRGKCEVGTVLVTFGSREAAERAVNCPWLRSKYSRLSAVPRTAFRKDKDGFFSVDFINSGMLDIREIMNHFSRFGEVMKVMSSGGAKNAVKCMKVSFGDVSSAVEAVRASANSKDFLSLDVTRECCVLSVSF